MTAMVRDHGMRLEGGAIVLRPLREADLPAVVQWETTAGMAYEQPHRQEYGEELIRHYRCVSNENGYIWIIEDKGTPVGLCWLGIGPGDGEQFAEYAAEECRFIEMYVLKPYRRQGIGRKVVHTVLRFAFGPDGATAICVNDIGRCSNWGGLKFFRHLGFKVHKPDPVPADRTDFHYYLVLTRAAYERLPIGADTKIASVR